MKSKPFVVLAIMCTFSLMMAIPCCWMAWRELEVMRLATSPPPVLTAAALPTPSLPADALVLHPRFRFWGDPVLRVLTDPLPMYLLGMCFGLWTGLVGNRLAAMGRSTTLYYAGVVVLAVCAAMVFWWVVFRVSSVWAFAFGVFSGWAGFEAARSKQTGHRANKRDISEIHHT